MSKTKGPRSHPSSPTQPRGRKGDSSHNHHHTKGKKTEPKQQQIRHSPSFEINMEPLEELLRQFNHSQIEESSRLQVIEYLEENLIRWADTISGSPAPRPGSNASGTAVASNPWQKAKPTIVSFGSYRLGVSIEESDLDLLVVAPPRITREEFFTSWVGFLKQLPEIECVFPIPEAYTPVLRFEINGISIDMLFASLTDGNRLKALQHTRVLGPKASEGPILRTSKRKEYIIQEADLQGQDEAGLRSLNGARVCQMLLDSVPDLDKYKVVLRAVKKWAMCKGIYSNVLGFLGGVNWAILVAYICKHPQNKTASPAALLAEFFRVFAHWMWPFPVALNDIRVSPPPGVLPMRVWNPADPSLSPSERKRYMSEVMPILTPAYPSMNSAYNVGWSQRERIMEELTKAWGTIQSLDFAQLFRPGEEMARHEDFLQVSIRAENRNDFVIWFRWVESRLRHVIKNLETEYIRTTPQSRFHYHAYDEDGDFSVAGPCASPGVPHEALFFIALDATNPEVVLEKDTRPLVSSFVHQVNAWNKRNPETMSVALSHVKAEDLPACCFQSLTDDEVLTPASSTPTADHHHRRYLECDSQCSGKITPQTSQGSADDDSLASSECSGLTSHDASSCSPRKSRPNAWAVPLI